MLVYALQFDTKKSEKEHFRVKFDELDKKLPVLQDFLWCAEKFYAENCIVDLTIDGLQTNIVGYLACHELCA